MYSSPSCRFNHDLCRTESCPQCGYCYYCLGLHHRVHMTTRRFINNNFSLTFPDWSLPSHGALLHAAPLWGLPYQGVLGPRPLHSLLTLTTQNGGYNISHKILILNIYKYLISCSSHNTGSHYLVIKEPFLRSWAILCLWLINIDWGAGNVPRRGGQTESAGKS